MQIIKNSLFLAIKLAKTMTNHGQNSGKSVLSHTMARVYWCNISGRQSDYIINSLSILNTLGFRNFNSIYSSWGNKGCGKKIYIKCSLHFNSY